MLCLLICVAGTKCEERGFCCISSLTNSRPCHQYPPPGGCRPTETTCSSKAWQCPRSGIPSLLLAAYGCFCSCFNNMCCVGVPFVHLLICNTWHGACAACTLFRFAIAHVHKVCGLLTSHARLSVTKLCCCLDVLSDLMLLLLCVVRGLRYGFSRLIWIPPTPT